MSFIQPAYAVSELKTVNIFRILEMPGKYAWPGRANVNIARLKLLVDEEGKGKIQRLFFSFSVSTQNDVIPWRTLKDISLYYRKERIAHLDLSNQESWLKIEERGNVTFYSIALDSLKTNIPMNKLSDVDMRISVRSDADLGLSKNVGFTFTANHANLYIQDNNKDVYNNTTDNLKQDWSADSFGVYIFQKNKVESAVEIIKERELTKYVGKNIRLKVDAEISTLDMLGSWGGDITVRKKETLGFIVGKKISDGYSLFNIDFPTGGDGWVYADEVTLK